MRTLEQILNDLPIDRRLTIERRYWELVLEAQTALAAGTQSAETNEDLAQSEGCQSGPKGNAQKGGDHD